MTFEIPSQTLLEAPQSLPMDDVLLRAMEELVKPFPAIVLNAWPLTSKFFGGFRMREFTILCGSTGSGKTTFLANLSAQLLIQNVKHFVMSVETGHTDFMKRILSSMEGRDLNTGEPIHPELLGQIFSRHERHLKNMAIEFSIYENRLSVEQLMSDIRHMVKKGCKIVFIDNLNFFMEVRRASDSIVEMDRVIHELIIFCKQVDVHLVMVMHPKKTDHGKVLSEFDIKGSSTAVQEAHNVFLFNRPSKEQVEKGEREWSDRELLIAKMRRRGAFVGKTIVYENHGTKYKEKGHQ